MQYVCLVCGMIINEKNYNFNRDAFSEENYLNNIKHCPFCGVSNEYFKDVKDECFENLKLNNEILDRETLKILDHAMKLEVFNGDFYKTAAIMSEKHSVKKMFEALARMEYVHAKVHQKLGGFIQLPKLTQLNYERYKGDENLISLSNKREIHAVEFYDKYAKEVCSVRISNIFKALANVEKEHIDITTI